ncbi:MAG: terminase [Novosphingobium sp.]|nr:terminase [Erythrobacter sp.]MBA4162396.1 terminase [Novosphingobium sp.]
MSYSPALRNRQRKLAALAGGTGTPKARAVEPDPGSAAGQEYAVLRAVLHDNLRKLQDVESHEARIPMKREFLQEFRAWVIGVIDADRPVQDEIVMTCLVWLIDCEAFEDALVVGRFALKHGLALPERYNRTTACFLREEIAEAALKSPAAVPHEILVEIDQLTAEADMPDQAKAKLDKALGRSWIARAADFDPSDETGPAGGAAAFASQGLTHLQRALKLNAKVGVKKDIERAEKMLRDLAPKGDE